MRERVLAIERAIRAHTELLTGQLGNILADPISISILGFSDSTSQWSATEVFTDVDSSFSIFIGGVKDAHNVAKLADHRITAILNCAALQAVVPRTTPSHYLALPLEDRPSFSLVPYFAEADAFLALCRTEGRNVLVHCMQGLNRSVAMCAAYLAKHHFGRNVELAIGQIASRRPFVLSNRSFILQLVRLEISDSPQPPSEQPPREQRPREGQLFRVGDIVERSPLV